MAWWIFKRRWHRKNATHPKKSPSPSPPDLESQLQEDSDVEGATSSHPKSTAKRQTANSNPNTQGDKDNDASHVQSKTLSITSHIPHAKSSTSSADDCSSPTRHTSTTSSSSRLLPPMPPTSPSVPTFSSIGNVLCPQGVDVTEKQLDDIQTDLSSAAHLLPMDIHIDRVNMDLESLLPIVISDEIEPAAILRLQQQQLQQQQKLAELPLKETKPSIPLPVSAIAMPSLRRPTFVSRRSTDSYSGNRPRMSISSSHPPPPPPPTIPPPAIPVSYPGKHVDNYRYQGGVSSEAVARLSIHDPNPGAQLEYIRGRHPRVSSENELYPPSSRSSSRRSISMDSSARWLEDQDAALSSKGRVSTSSQRSFQSIHPPPSTPPPPPPDAADLAQSLQSIQRRRHQKKPSQILSPCFFSHAESSSGIPSPSPLSPLSPPLSPLAIQVPRPSSRAFFQGPSSSSGRGTPGSATPGRASSESPVPRLTFPPKSSKTPVPAPQTPSQLQHRRTRSRSISQAETYGLTSNAFPTSSLVPEAPTSSTPVLKQETMASATQSYLLLRRPSLVLNNQHRQPSSMNHPAAFSEDLKVANSPASLVSTPVGSEPSPLAQRHRRRRSRSLNSWREHSSSSILSSSSTLEGPSHPEGSPMSEQEYSLGDQEKSNVGSVRDPDQELQAIIADARVIAAAKCAAIKAARDAARSRQSYPRIYG
ncbi:hypothetical protein BGZ68_008007, partial [Mortierella alpina]